MPSHTNFVKKRRRRYNLNFGSGSGETHVCSHIIVSKKTSVMRAHLDSEIFWIDVPTGFPVILVMRYYSDATYGYYLHF